MMFVKAETLDPADFDAVIVGGGPAGASCALWLKLLGFRPVIIERRPRLGGLQNDSPYGNAWIVPLPELSGAEVADNIHRNILSHDITCFLDTAVQSLVRSPSGFSVSIAGADGTIQLSAPYIVLASGVRPRSGGLKASQRLLIGPGAKIADTDFSGKKVAILGGGDNAFENFQLIREGGAAEVHIFARTVGARREFVNKTPTKHLRVGQYSVDTEAMTVSGRPYDYIVVLYGWSPNLDFADAFDLKQNDRGFIVTDSETTETSLHNVFAIGEVAQRMHPCCVTAMADGVVAAKEIQHRIEAGGRDRVDQSALVPGRFDVLASYRRG